MVRAHGRRAGTSSFHSVETDELNNSDEPSLDRLSHLWLIRTGFIEVVDAGDWPNNHASGSNSGSGSRTVTNGSYRVATGSTSSSHGEYRIKVASGRNPHYDKDSAFRSRVTFTNCDSGATGYITVDRVWNGNQGYGFKVGSGSLHGVCHDGNSETTASLTSLTASETLNLRAEFTAGSKIEFFVDDTKQGEITTGLPSGDNFVSDLCAIRIENSEAENKELERGEFAFSQAP